MSVFVFITSPVTLPWVPGGDRLGGEVDNLLPISGTRADPVRSAMQRGLGMLFTSAVGLNLPGAAAKPSAACVGCSSKIKALRELLFPPKTALRLMLGCVPAG